MIREKKSALVFDIETKEPAGRNDKHHLLGVSMVCAYDYQEDKFLSYEEHELDKLEELMLKRDLLIGFNTRAFDYKVLQPYFKKFNFANAPTLDIIENIERVVGFRVALNNLAKHTLGEEKSGHGLEAIEWYRQGEIEKIRKYCMDDVRLTRDLYEYGNTHGTVRFESRIDGLKSIPATWGQEEKETQNVKKVLEEAKVKKLLVEIDYVSSRPKEGEEARKKRDIEIHSIKGGTIEAYCHFRKDERNFKIWRVIGAEIKQGQTHTRPTLF